MKFNANAARQACSVWNRSEINAEPAQNDCIHECRMTNSGEFPFCTFKSYESNGEMQNRAKDGGILFNYYYNVSNEIGQWWFAYVFPSIKSQPIRFYFIFLWPTPTLSTQPMLFPFSLCSASFSLQLWTTYWTTSCLHDVADCPHNIFLSLWKSK